MNRAAFLALSLLFLAPRMVPAQDGQGVSGLATHRGALTEGVTVAAWRSLEDLGARKAPVAVSAPTGADGQYRLGLPPGEYYLVAGAGPNWRKGRVPGAGELYCFFGNNPISVPPRAWVPVGFNLVEAREDPPAEEGPSGVTGRLLFEGRPLERAYVFAYRPDQPRFRGQGQAFGPAGAGGAFSLRLPPGSYYLVARKRQQGALSGPLSHGDHIGYYHANPVVIALGERRSVIIEMAQRMDNLELDAGSVAAGSPPGSGRAATMAMGYQGRVVDAAGAPRQGLRVLVYEAGGDGTGTPLFISDPTDNGGRFILPLPRPGSFLLIARERTGGKPLAGEWYGKANGKELSIKRMIADAQIVVSPVPAEAGP